MTSFDATVKKMTHCYLRGQGHVATGCHCYRCRIWDCVAFDAHCACTAFETLCSTILLMLAHSWNTDIGMLAQDSA
ncbi:hypothetical protein ACFXTO_041504 [Malus domestica]